MEFLKNCTEILRQLGETRDCFVETQVEDNVLWSNNFFLNF